MRLSKNFHLNEFVKSSTADRMAIDNSPKDDEHLVNLVVLAHQILKASFENLLLQYYYLKISLRNVLSFSHCYFEYHFSFMFDYFEYRKVHD